MSFANPAFLWALPLLGVPIALHMMQWQVPRAIIFPSIRFIKKASDADRGKRGLRDLLTLLARLCLMALLIMLLAGPKMADVPLTPSETDGKRTVLIVDLSASMHAGDFKAALKQALDQIATDDEPATFLALGSADGVVHRTEVTDDPKRLASLISDWKPTAFEGRHGAAVSEAVSHAEGAPSPSIYVVSDFQAADWSGDALARLGRAGRVVPVPMQSALDANVAVIRADAVRLSRDKSVGLRVSATVRNFSIESKSMSVTCRQGEQSVTQEVTLLGGETRPVDLHLPNAGGARTTVEVATDDGYALDDSLWLWTGSRPALPLALLSGKGKENALGMYFVGHALSVRQPGHLPIEIHANGSDLLMDGRLGEVRAVVALDGFRDSGPLELQQISAWVKGGGTLICFAGDGFVNGLANLNTEGICATRPEIVHGDRAGLKTYFLGKYDTDSTELAPFAEAGLAFDSFPIFRYVGLEPPKESAVLIRFESGDPFLVRERLAKGAVYVVATGLSQEWSELATSRQFLPLVRRMLEASGAVDSGSDDITCRTSLSAETPFDAPGIVTVQDRPTVVNVSRLESNPDRLDPDAVAHGLSAGETTRVADASVIPGDDLTGPFALAVIALLLLELIVANVNPASARSKKGAAA